MTDDGPVCNIDGVGTPPVNIVLVVGVTLAGLAALGLIFRFARLMCGYRGRWASRACLPCFPSFVSIVDVTLGEVVAIGLYLIASAGPVIATGVVTKSTGTIAHYVGVQTQIALSVVIFPATRTSLWVTLFGIPFDRATVSE